MKKVFTKLSTLIFCALMAAAWSLQAQNPTYNCVAKNDTLVSAHVVQFDIYIERTGSTDLYLNNYQLSFAFDNALLNGGNIAVSYVSGSTQLGSFGPSSAIPNTLHVGERLFRINGPMPGTSGTLIPATGLKIGTFRITNNPLSPIPFAQAQLGLTPFTGGPYHTYVYAVTGGVINGNIMESDPDLGIYTTIVDITTFNTHTTDFTGPILNKPLTLFDVTGSGSYCPGGSGRTIGLSGSELGVYYRLYKDGLPAGNYVAGTGSALSWSNQTVGTYTVFAYRAATYIEGYMNGNAVVTLEPLPVCGGAVQQNTDPGECYATVSLVQPVTSAFCGPYTVSNDAPAQFPTGTTVVTWTLTDNFGYTSTCTQTVTVQDAENPAIDCSHSGITVNTDAGVCKADVFFPAATISDNCGVASTIYSHDPGTTFLLGATTVTVTATDIHNNSASCTFTITVVDNEAPHAFCTNITIQLDNSGNASIVAADVNNNSWDACGIASLAVAPDAFTCNEVGANTVVLTVTDNNTNVSTCAATVTVLDNIFPTITCHGPQLKLTDPGQCTYMAVGVEFDPAATWDNCSFTVINDHNNSASLAGALFDKGSTTVIWTITDASNNQATCAFTVIVKDEEAPQITCPADDTRNTNWNLCTYATMYGEFDPGALDYWDNCPGAYITNDKTLNSSLAGFVFPKGTTLVTWTVTDAAYNVSTCTYEITVVDLQEPQITCVPDQIRPTTGSFCAHIAVGTEFDPTFTWDNCPGATYLNDFNGQSTLAGAHFDKGTETVTWTITDASGNVMFCSFDVEVYDNEPPTITCMGNIQVNTDLNVCYYTHSGIAWDATFDDNCPGASMQSSYGGYTTFDGAVFNKGAHIVTWTATDASGLQATCSYTVTVVDAQFPVISCPGDQLRDTDAGVCSYTTQGAEFNPVSVWDNCPNETIQNTYDGMASLDGAIFPKGTWPVTWIVSDASHNSVLCSFLVTVEDNEPPVIICPTDVTKETDTLVCYYTGVGAEFDPFISDNCDNFYADNDYNGQTTLANGNFPKDQHLITWTVYDEAGATVKCVFTVTVIDVELPTITCPGNQVRETDPLICEYVVQGNEFQPLYNDNCPGSSILNDHNVFDHLAGAVFLEGTKTVFWQVTDASGNSAICSFDVTIEDKEIPQLTCPADITLCHENNNYQVIHEPYFVWDNCGVLSVVTNQPPVFPEGIHTVTFTATDIHANTNTCNMLVTQSGWMAVEVTQSDLPIFCQGAVVTLTANVTGTPAVAYLWSTGETTQSIEVGASGTYDVTVTNILGCHAYDTYTTVFDISDLLSSYIILARKEVKLEGTKIYDLGVGVKDNKGKIKVKHQSQITAPGTFARANKVEVDNSSSVTDIYLYPVTIPWPEYQFMPYKGGANIKVPNNTTMYLNDTLYKEVKVGKNATAIFTSPVVNIMKKLKVEESGTVRFSTCAVVRIKDGVDSKKHAVINPDDVSVIFYSDNCVHFGEGNQVTGVFYLGDHKSKDTTKHHVHIKQSKADRPGIYKVMFLTEKADIKKNNNLWPVPNCNFCDPNIPKDLPSVNEADYASWESDVIIENYPNPFRSTTGILFIMPEDDNVSLEVFDLTGKLLQTLYRGDVEAGQEYNFNFDAGNYPTGIYIYRLTANDGVYTGKMILNRD